MDDGDDGLTSWRAGSCMDGAGGGHTPDVSVTGVVASSSPMLHALPFFSRFPVMVRSCCSQLLCLIQVSVL